MEELFNIEDLNLSEGTIDNILSVPDNTENKTEKEELENQESKETKAETSPEETKIETKDNAPSKKEDSSTFSVFANLLKEEGVLSLDEEDFKDIKTADDLAALVKKQVEKSRFEHLSESQKRYLESVEAGIPQATFEKIEKEIKQLERISDKVIEDNQQARFDLIAFDFIEKGISKDKAIELANRSVRLGTDIEDAREALESLIQIKNEAYKKALIEKKEENKISLEDLKKKIDNKDVILKDIKLTPKQKTDIYNLISTKVDSDEEGRPLNEFHKWRKENGAEAEIILGSIFHLTNKFQNLGKILDISKSKASAELEKKLKENESRELNDNITSSNGDFTINI